MFAGDWQGFLDEGRGAVERDAIRAGERTGRPLGAPGFVRRLEKKLDRTLAKRNPGRNRRATPNMQSQSCIEEVRH